MKALALVESPDHVCCRYRIRAFEPALAAARVELHIQGLARGAWARLRQLRSLPAFDAILLQRKLLPAWQLRMIRQRTPRLLFDFDDAVLYRDSYDQRGPFDPKRGARFARTVQTADLVLAGNDFLAECARTAGAPASRVRVLPTCIDDSAYTPKTPSDTPSSSLELVWIGSSSTLNGLERQRPLFERLGREIPNLRLRMICDRFLRFTDLAVIPVSWTSQTEALEIARADVGISWIPDDRWSRGKCGLKLLQFQAAGLPVVANPVGVHPRMVEPGVSGFLPETDDDWVAALQTLAADHALRAEMGRAARLSLERRYSVRAWQTGFVSAVLGQELGPSPHLARTPSALLGNTQDQVGLSLLD